MLKSDEIKFLENQIKNTIYSIAHEHYQIVMAEEMGEQYEEEFPGWTETWITNRLKDLYFLILSFLEGREMHNLLETFKLRFDMLISSDNRVELLKREQTHPEASEELLLLIEFKRFLEPFKSFDYNQIKDDEVERLISVLKNTGFIIKNIKTKIAKEADIYNQVKWVLDLYYPTTKLRNKASFIHQFKSYNPDILIPELKVAIEYKYIDSPSDNIDEFLDQLHTDATNYKDDFRYETFIAVIYIENISIATPESIDVAWKSKLFPKNWHLVLSGHAIKTLAADR